MNEVPKLDRFFCVSLAVKDMPSLAAGRGVWWSALCPDSFAPSPMFTLLPHQPGGRGRGGEGLTASLGMGFTQLRNYASGATSNSSVLSK